MIDSVDNSILDIDMGNTRIKWRQCFLSADTLPGNNAPSNYGVSNYKESNWLAFDSLIVPPQRVRISCVVKDQRRRQIVEHCQNQWSVEPEFAVVQNECAGVVQAYAIKERLGVDRWLCLLAAEQQVGAAVIVSCGSAITVDLLAADGKHLGGYIVPGIHLMHHSLFSGTDAVKVAAAQGLEDLQPGRDTIDAVNKGVVAMVIGLIEHGLAIYAANFPDRPQILITGGDGEIVQRFLTVDSIYNPYLVLDGLAVALP